MFVSSLPRSYFKISVRNQVHFLDTNPPPPRLHAIKHPLIPEHSILKTHNPHDIWVYRRRSVCKPKSRPSSPGLGLPQDGCSCLEAAPGRGPAVPVRQQQQRQGGVRRCRDGVKHGFWGAPPGLLGCQKSLVPTRGGGRRWVGFLAGFLANE